MDILFHQSSDRIHIQQNFSDFVLCDDVPESIGVRIVEFSFELETEIYLG